MGVDREDLVIISFGRRLRVHREAIGWSQEHLAAEAGLDRTYVSGIERGVRNPSLRNIARLALAMGLPMRSMFDEGEPAEEDGPTGADERA